MNSPILEKHSLGDRNGGVKRLLRMVRQQAARLSRTQVDLEEIIQEVMIKMLSSTAVPRVLSSRWVYAVTRNVAMDYYRGKQKQARLVDYSIVLDVLDDSRFEHDENSEPKIMPFAVCEDPEPDAYDDLVQAVCSLPAEQRKAFVMFAADATYAEIAKATGVNIGTVRSRLYYAKRQLRTRIEQAT